MITAPIKIHDIFNYSVEVLREQKETINWVNLCAWRTFTQDELREFKDYVIWSLIAQQKNLSESFIREFIDYFDINDIAHYKEMDLNFIRELHSEHNLQLINVITYGNLEWGSSKRNEILNEYRKEFK